MTKRTIIILDAFLFFGLFSHSVILLILNNTLVPGEIAFSGASTRIMWRQAAEAIFSICSSIYVIGHFILFGMALGQKKSRSFRTICLYFVFQIVLLCSATIPFAVLDMNYWGDYMFPVWGTGIHLIFLFLIASAINFYCKKRQK